jgi:hypothetical protein
VGSRDNRLSMVSRTVEMRWRSRHMAAATQVLHLPAQSPIKRPPEGGLLDPISASDFTRLQDVGAAMRSARLAQSQDLAG